MRAFLAFLEGFLDCRIVVVFKVVDCVCVCALCCCMLLQALLESILIQVTRLKCGMFARADVLRCALCGEVIRGVPMVCPGATDRILHAGCVPTSMIGQALQAPGYRLEDDGVVFDPLVLTLHIGRTGAHFAVSCTSIAGDELAAASGLGPSTSLAHVHALFAAEMFGEGDKLAPQRFVLLLPSGQMLGKKERSRTLDSLVVADDQSGENDDSKVASSCSGAARAACLLPILVPPHLRDIVEVCTQSNTVLKMAPGIDSSLVIYHASQLSIEVAPIGRRKACVLAPTVPIILSIQRHCDAVMVSPALRVSCVLSSPCVDTWGRQQWQDVVEGCDLLLVTPQLFLDSLNEGHLCTNQFSVFTFCECQHFMSNNYPITKIVQLMQIRQATALPRILGVCAELKHKKASADATKRHVETVLCASFRDAADFV